MAMCWIYIHHKVLRVKVYWMTTFIVPIISGLPIVLFSSIWQLYFVFPMINIIGLIPTALITIMIGIFCIPFFIFLPLTGILGGWDEMQLKVFKKGVDLSGPSKIFFVPFYKSIMFGVKIGQKIKLHNRFRIPWEQPLKEINELMQAKLTITLQDQKKIVSKAAPWIKQEDLDKKLGN
jgi:hypothetical protein